MVFPISERMYGAMLFETWFVYGMYPKLPCSFQEFVSNAWHSVSPWLSLYYLDTVKAKTFKEILDTNFYLKNLSKLAFL